MATKKKTAKKTTAKKKAAVKAAPKAAGKPIKEPYTKTALYSTIAERTGLKKKDVDSVFAELGDIINGHIRRKQPVWRTFVRCRGRIRRRQPVWCKSVRERGHICR